jgi:glycerol-3-phosphate acyltransferase PlsX
VIVTEGFTVMLSLKWGELFYDYAHKQIEDPLIEGTTKLPECSPIIGVNGNVIVAHSISSPKAIKKRHRI